MTLGINNVMTLSVNNVMTSSVQKVVTHNTNYADNRYQQPLFRSSFPPGSINAVPIEYTLAIPICFHHITN